jgi:TRAP-type uncharacterized transport system fused permease subunit
VAAGVSGSRPMEVGFQSMRLGSAMYFVPFFFVLNPALILRGEPADIIAVLLTAIVGIGLIASALEGYLLRVGSMHTGVVGMLARLVLAMGGAALAIPGGGDLGLSHVQLTGVGAVLVIGAILLAKLGQRLHPPTVHA